MSILIELTEEQVKSVLHQVGRPVLSRDKTKSVFETMNVIRKYLSDKPSGYLFRNIELYSLGVGSSAVSNSLARLKSLKEVVMLARGNWQKL